MATFLPASKSAPLSSLLACLSLALLSTQSAVAANTSFVQANGIYFTVDGEVEYFTGTNGYFQMSRRTYGGGDVDEVLDEMQARDMNVMRIWAFHDQAEYGDCLQCAPNRQLVGSEKPTDWINENALVGLDKALAAANDRDIRLVLTLANNWNDYGGMNRYATWRGDGASHDDFYSDPTIKDWYKDFFDVLANRVNTQNGRTYKDDPTIFSWQLANEPRANSSNANDLNNWIDEMSTYIKSGDPDHMVSTGIEGFYGPANNSKNSNPWMQSQGTDFILNHLHENIDYATAHAYAGAWGWDPMGNTNNALAIAADYVEQHLDDATDILQMPFFLEEFGIERDNGGTGANSGPTTIRDEFFEDVYLGIQAANAQAGGAFGGTTNWMVFDTYTNGWDDGNGIFLPQDTSTDSILSDHAALLASLNVEIPGDYNGDGFIDGADYTVWRDTFAQNVTPGTGADGDGDGVIDQDDFDFWVQTFGTVVPSGSGAGTASVPEPASWIAALVGLVALLRLRKRA